MQYPFTAANTGAGKLSIAFIRLCPIFENSYASGPVRAAISAKSAPAEKNFEFPVMTRGAAATARSQTASVNTPTQARVSRFVRSSDRRRSRETPSALSAATYGEVTATADQ